jgi:hypothetical protein
MGVADWIIFLLYISCRSLSVAVPRNKEIV